MVSRKNLNVPAYKIGNIPVFWLKEIKSEWFCGACKRNQKNNISLQVDVKRREKSFFLCLECAYEMCDEVLTNVKILQKGGPDALRLAKDM
jgi:hypothetical protein